MILPLEFISTLSPFLAQKIPHFPFPADLKVNFWLAELLSCQRIILFKSCEFCEQSKTNCYPAPESNLYVWFSAGIKPCSCCWPHPWFVECWLMPTFIPKPWLPTLKPCWPNPWPCWLLLNPWLWLVCWPLTGVMYQIWFSSPLLSHVIIVY